MKFLKGFKGNLPALKFSTALEKAALDHAHDIGQKGIRGHKGCDGSNFKDRIERYAIWGGGIYQTIMYHDAEVNAVDIVMELIIDAGYADKTNRKKAMGSDFKEVGAAYGHHKTETFLTVIVWGDQIVEKESKEFEEYHPKEKKPEDDKPFEKNWEKWRMDIFNF